MKLLRKTNRTCRKPLGALFSTSAVGAPGFTPRRERNWTGRFNPGGASNFLNSLAAEGAT
jgi:hypothetical protein